MALRALGILSRHTTSHATARLPEFLGQLMPDHERRESPRVPFCRHVTLYFDKSPLPVPAVIRDVSEDGIGLMHDVPIELEEATVRLHSDAGKTLCARVKILWCNPSNCSCYTSGGTFVRVFEVDPIQLPDTDNPSQRLS